MSGQCYSCGTGFSFFKKELGCKNCGFAFCKDCLTKKTAVPKLNNEKHKVCNKCFNILTGKVKPSDTPAQYSPPEAYKKRIAALSNPEANHNQARKKGTPTAAVNMAKYRGMGKEDIAIAQRLEKLKQDRAAAAPPVPSQKDMEDRLAQLKADRPSPPGEEDMRERLAKLRGQDPAQAKKPHVFQSDNRNQQQQVDDLMDQIGEEVMIDSRDMEPRSDHLTGDIQNDLNMADSSKPSQVYAKNIMPPPDNFQSVSGEKVDWNEINGLVHQMAAEMEVDAQRAIANLQKDKELMGRLEKLREDREKKKGDNSNEQGEDSPAEAADDSDLEDEDAQTRKLIKQLLEEQALDDKVGDVEPYERKCTTKDSKKKHGKSSKTPTVYTWEKEEKNSSEEEELPWCCMCNEDATLRCHGCDGDLYCSRCYRQGHDREDYEDHRTSKYHPPDKKR